MNLLELLPTPPAYKLAIAMLRVDEGVRYEPYDDATGSVYVDRIEMIVRRLYKSDATLEEPISVYDAIECSGLDPLGHLTIGVGRNLEARPVSDNVVNLMLWEDLEANERLAAEWLGVNGGLLMATTRYYYYDLLSPERQAVLLGLAHWGGLRKGKAPKFKTQTCSALGLPAGTLAGDGYYFQGAEELLYKDGWDRSKGRSGWYEISPARIERYAEQWRTNTLHSDYRGEA